MTIETFEKKKRARVNKNSREENELKCDCTSNTKRNISVSLFFSVRQVELSHDWAGAR